jgi:hypothetical protein
MEIRGDWGRQAEFVGFVEFVELLELMETGDSRRFDGDPMEIGGDLAEHKWQ